MVIQNMVINGVQPISRDQKTKRFSTCWTEFEFQTSELHIYLERELESKK